MDCLQPHDAAEAHAARCPARCPPSGVFLRREKSMNAMRRNTLAKAVKLSLLLALPGMAAAQEPTTPTDTATTLDAVTVTGSRIKRADVESQVPVQTLSREDIERTGLTSIGDIVQELTGSGSQNICSTQCFNRKMLFITSTSHFSKTTIHVTCQIPQDKKVHKHNRPYSYYHRNLHGTIPIH
jgi:hypothetical protein